MRLRNILFIAIGLSMSAGTLLAVRSMIQQEHYWVERAIYVNHYGGYLTVQTPFTTCGMPERHAQHGFQVPPESDRGVSYWYALKFPANPGLPISRDEAVTLGLSLALEVAVEYSLLGTGRVCGFGR